jgi:hypothetical protein
LVERFDGLERTLRKLASEQSSGRAEVARQQTSLAESLAAERRRSERLLMACVVVALIVAVTALVLPFLRA